MRVLTNLCLLLSLLSPACLVAAESPFSTVQTAITKVMAIIDSYNFV